MRYTIILIILGLIALSIASCGPTPRYTHCLSLFSINVRLTVRQKCHLFGLRWYQMATLWMRPGTDASADSQRQRIS